MRTLKEPPGALVRRTPPRNEHPAGECSTEIGLSDLVRVRYQSFLTSRATVAEMTILHSRRELAAAQIEVLQLERRLYLERQRQTAGMDAELILLEHSRDVEQWTLQTETLRHQRLELTRVFQADIPSSGDRNEPDIGRDFDDQQIERLALRAVTRFSTLGPREAERSWSAWRAELHRQMPENVAAEVERRADELRAIVRT